MNTTLHPASAVRDFHGPVVFWPVVATSVVIAAVSAIASFPGWLSVAVVVVVIATLGVPHGAVDHLVFDAIDGRDDGTSRRRLVRNYVIALVGVGLAWLIVSPLALAAFVVVSVHHFGQSDLAHLRLPMPRQLVVQWSRGLFLVGLPLVAHLDTVAPIIQRLGGGDPAGWPWLADNWWLWCGLLVIQHVAVGTVLARTTEDRSVIRRESVAVAVLTLLFLTADPLIGFAVYFGLWHSFAHLLVLADVLGTGPSPLRSVARLAAPLTGVSLLGLAAVGTGTALSGQADLLVPAVFVFISVLTFPHLVVVEHLWRTRHRRDDGQTTRHARSPTTLDDRGGRTPRRTTAFRELPAELLVATDRTTGSNVAARQYQRFAGQHLHDETAAGS